MAAPIRAHDAVGPVAAQHEFGVHIVLGPVRPIDERDPYPAVAFFFDLCDFDVATEFGVRVALQIGAQQRLEFRLVEHIGLGEPMRT